MANFRLAARRFVTALAIAGAMAVPPAVAGLAGTPPVAGPVAEPPTCTNSGSPSGDSLNCAPDVPPAPGAPNLETGTGSE